MFFILANHPSWRVRLNFKDLLKITAGDITVRCKQFVSPEFPATIPFPKNKEKKISCDR